MGRHITRRLFRLHSRPCMPISVRLQLGTRKTYSLPACACFGTLFNLGLCSVLGLSYACMFCEIWPQCTKMYCCVQSSRAQQFSLPRCILTMSELDFEEVLERNKNGTETTCCCNKQSGIT